MSRSFGKNFFSLFFAVLIGWASIQQSVAFSPMGPKEVWQIPSVGNYDPDISGPRNIGDQYRLNSPIITYAFDPTFVDYFGRDGMKAVEEAIAIFNKLPRASRASKNLTEFLTDDAMRSNERAGAVNLIDLKSMTLNLLIEHMGLIGERFVFNLRERQVPGGSPPPCTFNYTTVIRNFDPITRAPSRYVNGTTYSYSIFDTCPDGPGGEAVEFAVDPTDIPFSAVASYSDSVAIGRYFMGLTRDDFGGLRYLYERSRWTEESLTSNAVSSVYGPWQPVDIFGTNTVSTNTLAVRGGVEKITYRKAKFLSRHSSQFKPVVLNYKLQREADGTESVRRLVDYPDIIFRAEELAPDSPSASPFPIPAVTRSANIFLDNPDPDVGPGVILPQTTFTYNKLGPFFFQTTPNTIFEDAIPGFVWGSFDGTTNDPVVYPVGTTIHDIEDLVLRAY
jgi:hypothetical protein